MVAPFSFLGLAAPERRRRARPDDHPAARLAAAPDRRRLRRAGPRGRRGERRRVLERVVEGLRHGRRRVLRRAAARQQLEAQSVGTHAGALGHGQHGEDVVIVPSLKDEEEIKQRFPKGYKAVKPYLRLTPQPNL